MLRLAARLALFLAASLFLHGLVQWLFPGPYSAYSRFAPLEDLRAAASQQVPVYLFGDSVADYRSPEDRDPRPFWILFTQAMR
ncbi:MAG: hypothetical protein AB1758_25910, partial [Candidatus Eremiobacterota bacterium]